jgi:hypothetical protein
MARVGVVAMDLAASAELTSPDGSTAVIVGSAVGKTKPGRAISAGLTP